MMEELGQKTRKYLDLTVDALKLRTIEGLSVGVSRVLALMTVLMLAMIALSIFAFASVLLLGKLIGSLIGATFIIGALFLVLLIILLVFRKRLFLDMSVRLFVGIFYETNKYRGISSFSQLRCSRVILDQKIDELESGFAAGCSEAISALNPTYILLQLIRKIKDFYRK